MKKKLAALLVIPMLLLLVFAGCSSQGGSKSSAKATGQSSNGSGGGSDKAVDGNLKPLKKPVTVTIAEDGSASGAGFYIAKERGYFKDYNINVKFATFANSDDMLPALASGKIDIAGGISSASFFNSIAQGIEGELTNKKC